MCVRTGMLLVEGFSNIRRECRSTCADWCHQSFCSVAVSKVQHFNISLVLCYIVSLMFQLTSMSLWLINAIRCQFGLTVTLLGASTKLLYIEPGWYCHLSAAQTRQCQTTVKVIALAPDTTTHPVQGCSHHIQGFVDICPAIPRRAVAAPGDDAVTTVH